MDISQAVISDSCDRVATGEDGQGASVTVLLHMRITL